MSVSGESSSATSIDSSAAVDVDVDSAPVEEAVAPPPTEVAPASTTTDADGTDTMPAGELLAMVSAIERFHGRAEEYESIIRRMQSRIEELQADQVRELLKPVIVKLASLHSEMTDAKDRAQDRGDDVARKDYDFFATEIEDALSLLDIESIGAAPMDEFVASRHAARRRVDTDDPALDRRIAKVMRQGFTYVGAERVFLPAMVNVYRHVSPPQDASVVPAETIS